MPTVKKEEPRILPPEGSKHWPAYKVKLGGGREAWRYIVRIPGKPDEPVTCHSLPEARIKRQGAEAALQQHRDLNFERAIALYIAAWVKGIHVKGGNVNEDSVETLRRRLVMFFEPVLRLPVARFKAALGVELYLGKEAPELDGEGNPIVLIPGLIHRPTKRPKGRRRLPRKSRAAGVRSQVCRVCGGEGHNSRKHRGEPIVVVDPAPPVFEPPAADTHHAALREAKKFAQWLCDQGHVVAVNGKHPLADVAPYGHKTKKGFGKADLTDPELALLDAACVMVLETLDRFIERERLPWRQRAVAVLLCIRCGFRKGELLTAQVRQFSILRKSCAQIGCEEDHGGHVAGTLQVVHENAKTGTSEGNVPILEDTMVHVLPLLEGKSFEQFFLAGKPPGGASWDRNPNIGLSENWLNYGLEELCAIAGVRRENPHGLRGAFTDSRLRQGDPFEEVARRARHGNFATTRRHYASAEAIAENQQRAMRERLGYAHISSGRAN